MRTYVLQLLNAFRTRFRKVDFSDLNEREKQKLKQELKFQMENERLRRLKSQSHHVRQL